MREIHPKAVAELDGFITLLRVACEEKDIYERMEKILALPDEHRKMVIHALVADMKASRAPVDFVTAIACLIDTDVAEKAYEVIFSCQRRIAR